MSKPVVIAGAGISGLVAAINLARAGREVTVHEMRQECGARFHGDLQALDDWLFDEHVSDFLKRANLRLDFLHQPVARFTLVDRDRQARELSFGAPIMYLLRRGPMAGTLDQALKQQALEAGVKIQFASRADPQAREVDIVACGPRGAYGIVVGYLFETSACDGLTVIFDDSLAPGGYGCLAIMDGIGEVGAIVTRQMRNAQDYRERTLEAFQRLHRFEMRAARPYSGYGTVLRKPKRDKVRIGEAGGFQDELWGFGMRFAMESGVLAARALLEGRDFWRLADERLVPVVRRCSLNRRAVNQAGDGGYVALASRLAGAKEPRQLLRLFHEPGPMNFLRSMLALGLKV